jgi:hypothetical protein
MRRCHPIVTDALFANDTGNSNMALRDEAGSNLVDGEGNIYIGAQVQARWYW